MAAAAGRSVRTGGVVGQSRTESLRTDQGVSDNLLVLAWEVTRVFALLTARLRAADDVRAKLMEAAAQQIP